MLKTLKATLGCFEVSLQGLGYVSDLKAGVAENAANTGGRVHLCQLDLPGWLGQLAQDKIQNRNARASGELRRLSNLAGSREIAANVLRKLPAEGGVSRLGGRWDPRPT
jgi:hypothetical protein